MKRHIHTHVAGGLRAANGRVNVLVFRTSLGHLSSKKCWVASSIVLVGICAELAVVERVVVWLVRVVIPIEAKSCNDGGKHLCRCSNC